jgi:hypothetical protein
MACDAWLLTFPQLRDLKLVGGKLRVVLMPSNTSEETLKALRDCRSWHQI